MIKSKKHIAVLSVLLIGSHLLIAKENVGMKKSAAPANQSRVLAGCSNTQAQTDLSINNVRARVLNGGDLWWNYNDNTTGVYEVPSGSGKNSIYAGALWIAGLDAGNNIHAACQTYRQTGSNDFWAGPISKKIDNSIDVSPEICTAYDRFWILNKEDVESFVATGNGGASAADIASWPGNGDLANGEMKYLAPFFDNDGNGLYEPAEGDYPHYLIQGDYVTDTASGLPICNDYLFGDRTIWWVFNDVGNIHSETNSESPIGLEIRAQAFAFSTTDQINSMTFYKYEIINRSEEALLGTYFGQWCDPDLGDAADDYVGCDVGLGLGFVYNADDDDGTASGYGVNPPACGIDFFQGPLANPGDSIDNDRDGITDEPGEQIIMSKFIQYENTNTTFNGNPGPTDDYYQYLSGLWTNGNQITYGGNGNGVGPGATATPCNFMFPGNTDPAFPTPWTMAGGGLQPADMRFIQSAGTFTLQPGAVNYVTTGVVWAQSIGGGALASVELMKIADAKAQALFDACFKVLAGPEAPDVAIRELDKELIITLTNTNGPKVESYSQVDPVIPKKVPSDTNPAFFVDLTEAERKYNFEGYKIYQLVDETVKVSDLDDITKAKIVAAYDINNGVGIIVNFEYDDYIKKWVPVQKTDSLPANLNVEKGLQHSIKVTTDLFSGRPLVNFQPYYFIAVSYAYNNFRPFDYNNTIFTQSKPYVLGAKNTKAYSGIPHKTVVNNGGMILNSYYKQPIGAGVKRIEGQGNGGKVLDFATGVEDEIFVAPDYRTATPVYAPGKGPITFAVIDPVKVSGGDYSIRFNGVADTSNFWVYQRPDLTNAIDSLVTGLKVLGDHYVDAKGYNIDAHLALETGEPGAINNGFLEATATFSGANWLTGVKDNDAIATRDWIKSGKGANDFNDDPDQVYEGVLNGTWAPFAWVDDGQTAWSPKFFAAGGFLKRKGASVSNSLKYEYMNSVDLVITNDQTKWTRSIVFETGPANRFNIRGNHSVDKNGDSTTVESTFIGANGMGWFPGYAVNLETGERLNIAFGENSADAANNGKDMLWNPTSIDTGTVYGGRHYVYIFNHVVDTSFTPSTNDLSMTKYDDGALLYSYANQNSLAVKRNFLRSCIWAGMPVLVAGQTLRSSDVRLRFRVSKTFKNYIPDNVPSVINNGDPYYEYNIPTNLGPSTNLTENATDALDLISVVPNPYYAYSSYERTIRDQLDNRVRFINLPSNCTVKIFTLNGTLVRTLTRNVAADVSEGYAVEANKEDKNLSSTLDWDLNNTAGIKVASGVYIIHIDAGSLGEKVIKWFGIMRPIDLDTF